MQIYCKSQKFSYELILLYQHSVTKPEVPAVLIIQVGGQLCYKTFADNLVKLRMKWQVCDCSISVWFVARLVKDSHDVERLKKMPSFWVWTDFFGGGGVCPFFHACGCTKNLYHSTNDFIFGKKIDVTLILCICLWITSTYCLCSKVTRDNQVMNTSVSVAFLEANCGKLPVYKGQIKNE